MVGPWDDVFASDWLLTGLPGQQPSRSITSGQGPTIKVALVYQRGPPLSTRPSINSKSLLMVRLLQPSTRLESMRDRLRGLDSRYRLSHWRWTRATLMVGPWAD
eukprot:6067114-Pyramimonas_sp.AAC.1